MMNTAQFSCLFLIFKNNLENTFENFQKVSISYQEFRHETLFERQPIFKSNNNKIRIMSRTKRITTDQRKKNKDRPNENNKIITKPKNVCWPGAGSEPHQPEQVKQTHNR